MLSSRSPYALLLRAGFTDRNQAVGLPTHRIGADEQPPIHPTERVEPRLTVIPPVVVDLSNLIHQHLGAKGERDTVLEAIDLVLAGVKLDIHATPYGYAVWCSRSLWRDEATVEVCPVGRGHNSKPIVS